MLRLFWDIHTCLLLLCFLSIEVLGANESASTKMGHEEEAEEVRFFTGTWEQTLEWAGFTKKPIMVYLKQSSRIEASAHLEKMVFQHPSSAKYLNSNYINLRVNLNALNGEGFSLASKHNVRNYPCLLFFNPKGLLLLKYEMQAERGINLRVRFKQILNESERRLYDTSPTTLNVVFVNGAKNTAIPPAFREFLNAKSKYELGKKDQAFLLDFVRLLCKFQESYHYVVEEYMDLYADLDDDDYCRFVLNYADNINNQAFKVLVKEREHFEQKLGAVRVEMTIKQTLRKGILEAKYAKDTAAFKRCMQVAKLVKMENQKDFLAYLRKIYHGK